MAEFDVQWKAQATRRALLLAILLDLVLIGGRALLYAPFFAQPDSWTYLVPPVAALLVYGAAVIAITTRTSAQRWSALRVGALIGILAGGLWAVNLTLETFATFPGSAGLLFSAPFLLGGFALWGIGAGITARQTGSIPLGVVAAVSAALVCVVITVSFGTVLAYTSLPRLEANLATDPDYLRSGWRDLRAFAIANQFGAAASHLIAAPIIAAVVGLVGGLLSAGWDRLQHKGGR